MGTCISCCHTTPKELTLQDIRNQPHPTIPKNELENYEYKNTRVFIPPISVAYVCKVYDGDTFTIATKFPWDKVNVYRFSVRVKGIDCPEMKTTDMNEKEVALLAKAELVSLVQSNNNWVVLENIIYDKYGRLCADVYIGETHLAEYMIKKRLAVAYDGGTKHCPANWKLYHTKGKMK